MTVNAYKWCELVILFAMLPCALALSISPLILIAFVLMALIYATAVAKRGNLFVKKGLWRIPKDAPWQKMLLRFGVFALFSSALMAIYLPEKLFIVPLENPAMWVAITLFYSICSVYPQEFIYRYFFFWRYQQLLSSKHGFIALNAAVFCIAHLLFQNYLVLALTLIGGVLFGMTYRRTNSLMFTSIEHSLYGVWLFTIGAGEMLAFPMPG